MQFRAIQRFAPAQARAQSVNVSPKSLLLKYFLLMHIGHLLGKIHTPNCSPATKDNRTFHPGTKKTPGRKTGRL